MSMSEKPKQDQQQARAKFRRSDVQLPHGLKEPVCKAIFGKGSGMVWCRHEDCNKRVFVKSHPAAHLGVGG